MKKTVSIILALALCFSLVPVLSSSASAATNWPSLSKSAYCEYTVTKTIYNYRDAACTTRGTCNPAKSYNSYTEPGDVCYITGITSKSVQWMFPTSNGYKTAYSKLDDVFGSTSSPIKKVISAGKATTYVSPKGKAYGYTEKGDAVFILPYTSSSRTFIIYTAKNGKRAYKAAFVKTSDLQSIIMSSTKTSASSAQTKALKLAEVASNEVGYHGTKKDGTGTGDYTKYGSWIGNNGVYWCAEFVSYCCNKAGVSTSVVPKTASTLTMGQKSNSYNKWTSTAHKTIKKGDIIFFSKTKSSLTNGNGSKSVYHVGIVWSCNNSSISIIEGNTSNDYVKKNSYKFDSNTGKISGLSGCYFCGYISVH